MTWDTLLFSCAICQREIKDYPGRNGRDRHIKPVCLMCEHRWNERVGKIHAGAFMDRRKAMHINALAEALHSDASIRKWEGQHGGA